ncbi:MAG: hypothetical protein AAFV38_05740, partial [Pseudomonadota bacterium]
MAKGAPLLVLGRDGARAILKPASLIGRFIAAALELIAGPAFRALFPQTLGIALAIGDAHLPDDGDEGCMTVGLQRAEIRSLIC